MGAAAAQQHHAAPSPKHRDSWERSPDAEFSEERKRRLCAFFSGRGSLGDEERMILAIAFHGPATPLAALARAAGLSGTAKTDSARKQGRRVCDRLRARGILEQHHVRARFEDCTHTKTEGTAGRLECQRLRKAAGVKTGCVAHHGHDVRTLAAGLTPAELARRLAIPSGEIAALVRERRAKEADARREAGIPANDIEAREWRGESGARGLRGTNHTSPRRVRGDKTGKVVPPIPPEGLSHPEPSASQVRAGGDTAAAPAARNLALREATPPTTASDARPESFERGRARDVPIAKVVAMDEARRTRATVEWFKATWTARGLPPLNELETRQVLWCRAKQLTREELSLAIARAKRAARSSPVRVFARVFANRGVLAELVHEERRDGERAGTAARGASPARVSFGERGEDARAVDLPGGAAAAPRARTRAEEIERFERFMRESEET